MIRDSDSLHHWTNDRDYGLLFDDILTSFHSNYSSGNVQDLVHADCVNTFASTFVSNYSSVILITNVTNTTNSFLAGGLSLTGKFDDESPSRSTPNWMCGSSYGYCTIESLLNDTALTVNLTQSWSLTESYRSTSESYSLPVAVNRCMAVKAASRCQVS